MPRKKSAPKVSAGVTFEEPVIEYIDRLSMKLDRARSYTINMIVKEHAARHGIQLEPAVVQAKREA